MKDWQEIRDVLRQRAMTSINHTGWSEMVEEEAFTIACKDIAELEGALEDAEEWLIWASGAFDTEEKQAAWVKCGRPAVERIRAALKGKDGQDE